MLLTDLYILQLLKTRHSLALQRNFGGSRGEIPLPRAPGGNYKARCYGHLRTTYVAAFKVFCLIASNLKKIIND